MLNFKNKKFVKFALTAACRFFLPDNTIKNIYYSGQMDFSNGMNFENNRILPNAFLASKLWYLNLDKKLNPAPNTKCLEINFYHFYRLITVRKYIKEIKDLIYTFIHTSVQKAMKNIVFILVHILIVLDI